MASPGFCQLEQLDSFLGGNVESTFFKLNLKGKKIFSHTICTKSEKNQTQLEITD